MPTIQTRKRGTQFIPESSNQMQERFVNYLMKKGKKSTARKILNDTFKIIAKKTSSDPEKIFRLAIDKVKPVMEVKPKRIGGAVYQIPLEVKVERQLALTFRWILGAARSKKGSPMCERLATELIEASNEQGTAMKKKLDTERMAQANKAFAHFAKY
ncbi:MAG: 30S ribosomal protein S7 [Candidatus Gracilibacteria bacterium]